jgi:hypothetical protein
MTSQTINAAFLSLPDSRVNPLPMDTPENPSNMVNSQTSSQNQTVSHP